MSGCNDRIALLHAYVDGELDAANSAAFEDHLAACPECTAELARIETLRSRLRGAGLRDPAPVELRAMVTDLASARRGPLPRVRSPALASGRAWRDRAVAFLAGGGLGLAAGLALTVALERAPARSEQDQIVAGHVRSLLAGHLTDVASSDRHQVRPWFNGRADFAPPTPDLAPQGFPLVGGRLDYVDGRVIAAVVYRRRLHPLNLFVRPASTATPDAPVTSKVDGYNLVRWRQGDLEFWAISDLNARELHLFQSAYRSASG